MFGLSLRKIHLKASWWLLGLSGFMAAAACSDDIEFVGITDQPNEGKNALSCDEVDGCFKDPTVALHELEIFAQPASDENPAPEWAYPLPNSVHPSNLSLLTLQFRRGSSEQTLFELSLVAETGERKFYLPCLSAGGDACTYQVPESFWREAAQQFAGEEVELLLRGARETDVSAASTLRISFSAEAVEGGLYYWSPIYSLASESWGLYRLVFGGRQAVAYIAPKDRSLRGLPCCESGRRNHRVHGGECFGIDFRQCGLCWRSQCRQSDDPHQSKHFSVRGQSKRRRYGDSFQ